VVSVLGRQEDETRTYTDVDYVQEIVAGNYSIPILTAELSASVLEEKGGGTFIGISSVAGDRGRQGNYLYGSAKAGYTAYLSGLRNKLGKTNTHVVTVRPGIIRTPLTSKQDFPPALMGEASTVAKDVYVAMQKKKNNIYTPWFWRWIMLVIRSVPEMLFKRLDL
jgi:decaprenylphospho-beta-D-erythro-pentofuranosid-2-ulose 2-reductase